MADLTMLQGLIGSGKTTLAKRMTEENPNSIRVNRDELRLMLHPGRSTWSAGTESFVKTAEMLMAREALALGRDVIVDDTNFRNETVWREFVEKFNLERESRAAARNSTRVPRPHNFVVRKLDTPLTECIRRDATRSGSARLGRGAVERTALEWGQIDLSGLSHVAIFDIDGTLANLDHRLQFRDPDSVLYNMNHFYNTVADDIPYLSIWEAAHFLSQQGYTIICVSGRPVTCGHETNEWLRARQVPTMHLEPLPISHLFMRKANDHVSDKECKREIWTLMQEAGLRQDAVKIVLDDRLSICELWLEQDLPLVKVARGCVEALHYKTYQSALPHLVAACGLKKESV